MHMSKNWQISLLACVFLGIGGCARCNDHLFVHVEQPQSHVPIASASVEFRPPLNILPPPVWRGKTDINGDLRICVDLPDRGFLQIIIRHMGCEYGGMLSSSDVPLREYVLNSFDRNCPEIGVVVERVEKSTK